METLPVSPLLFLKRRGEKDTALKKGLKLFFLLWIKNM
jgi:hypothetical protein